MKPIRRNVKKSGDSARIDAEEANAAARVTGEPMNPERLLSQLQGATDEAKERGDSPNRIAAIEAGLQMLAEAMKNLNEKMEATQKTATAPAGASVVKPRLECGTCRQAVGTVCKGDHVLVQVIPKNFDNYRLFPGVTVNGIPYIGRTFLPASLVAGVLAQVSHWENQEARKQRRGGRIAAPTELRHAAIGHTPIIG